MPDISPTLTIEFGNVAIPAAPAGMTVLSLIRVTLLRYRGRNRRGDGPAERFVSFGLAPLVGGKFTAQIAVTGPDKNQTRRLRRRGVFLTVRAELIQNLRENVGNQFIGARIIRRSHAVWAPN